MIMNNNITTSWRLPQYARCVCVNGLGSQYYARRTSSLTRLTSYDIRHMLHLGVAYLRIISYIVPMYNLRITYDVCRTIVGILYTTYVSNIQHGSYIHLACILPTTYVLIRLVYIYIRLIYVKRTLYVRLTFYLRLTCILCTSYILSTSYILPTSCANITYVLHTF